MLLTIARFGNRLFTKYLLVTNIGASCLLTTGGDFIVQHIHHHHQAKKSQNKLHADKWVEWDRSGRVFKIGAIIGVFNHYWYALLDSKLPGTTAKTILKKVLLDQVIASPVCSTIYFVGISLLEQEPFREAFNGFKEKFLVVYMADWSYWPIVQGINFKFIPDKFRVIYVGASSLVWTVFLSYMQFEDEKHLGATHESDGGMEKHPDQTKMKKTIKE